MKKFLVIILITGLYLGTSISSAYAAGIITPTAQEAQATTTISLTNVSVEESLNYLSQTSAKVWAALKQLRKEGKTAEADYVLEQWRLCKQETLEQLVQLDTTQDEGAIAIQESLPQQPAPVDTTTTTSNETTVERASGIVAENAVPPLLENPAAATEGLSVSDVTEGEQSITYRGTADPANPITAIDEDVNAVPPTSDLDAGIALTVGQKMYLCVENFINTYL